MAFGITPNRIVTIPLEDYNSEHYLTLLYQSMVNLGWHIGYFDHDGIIAYTNISWESYSEEVSARIKGNQVVIKSECVGYQAWFFDYGKNRKNLDRLLGEITYAEFHLQNNLEQTTQELMDAVPEKQFLSLDDPPMAGKEQLRGFFSPFVPVEKYLVTPILVILNTLIFFFTSVCIHVLPLLIKSNGAGPHENIYLKIYLWLGFNNRTQVLNGQVWRLLTNTFLHFSTVHLVGNMIVLVYIGSLIESKLGKWNYLLMYLFTGICASMVSILWNSAEISGGASGAIFGLFGILLALVSTDFYEKSARKALLISTAIFVAYNIVPIGEGIDHAAHFGGLVSGYLFGWMAYFGLSHKNSSIKKWGLAFMVTAVTVVFVSCAIIVSPQYQTKQYEALMDKAEKQFNDINSDFYHSPDSITRQQKLDIMEQKALPEIKELKKTADKITHLILSRRKKKEAIARAKLIDLECQTFQLLYLQFKEQNNYKYQAAIDNITEQINKVRTEYAKDN